MEDITVIIYIKVKVVLVWRGGGGVWELVGEGCYTHIKEEPNPTKDTSVYSIPYTHTVPFSSDVKTYG